MDEVVIPPEPRWPGLSGARWTAIGVFAALVAAGGWAAGRAQRATPGGEGAVYAGLLLVLAFLAFLSGAALARGGDRVWPVLGAGTSTLAALALVLAAASAGGTGGAWGLGLALVGALGAVATARADRRNGLADLTRRREDALREQRLHTEGLVARATVVAVAKPSETSDEGRFRTTLTLRYTEADGAEHTVEHPHGFPAYARPRAGLGATVRYLPDRPADLRVEVDEPDAPQDVPPGAPQDASDLLSQLERLHRLHRDGGLTPDEFALAKQRLISPG
ncbi:hypothetical protein AB0K51_17390 [Kitasatospora sp. NPDC049285]|uniref:DUF3592 domain-containing protein n=1 Tax=Kitasatospora sp. NPDC049285 TaxID=3157096 RepID=UPI00342A7BA2